MPRPPRKKIPFQPTGNRVNVQNATSVSTNTKAIPASLDQENGTRKTRRATAVISTKYNEFDDLASSVSPEDPNTALGYASRGAKSKNGTDMIEASGPLLDRIAKVRQERSRGQKTKSVSANTDMELSGVSPSLEIDDSALLLDEEEDLSTAIENAGEPFPSFSSAPVSRRPSISRSTIPLSATKPQMTPSFLGNFKRRPRQPSILQMVQQHSETGAMSPGDEDDTTMFSLSRSMASPSPTAPRLISADSIRSSSSRKRKRSIASAEDDGRETLKPSLGPVAGNDLPSDPAELISEPSAEVQIPATMEQPLEEEHSVLLHEEDIPLSPTPNPSPTSSDLAAAFTTQRKRARSRLLYSAQAKSYRPRALETPVPVSAAPASSPISPATSPISLPSSSPSRSPQMGRNRRGRNDGDKKLLRTADLQSLLPQRKGRNLRSRSLYNTNDADGSIHSESTVVETSEVSDKEEYGGRWPARRQRRTAASATRPNKGRPMTASKANSKSTKQPAPRAKASRSKKTTYERRQSSDAANADEEEEDAHDETDEPAVAAAHEPASEADTPIKAEASAELQAAAEKFKEIDAWELSFESCDVHHDGDSSPWR